MGNVAAVDLRRSQISGESSRQKSVWLTSVQRRSIMSITVRLCPLGTIELRKLFLVCCRDSLLLVCVLFCHCWWLWWSPAV